MRARARGVCGAERLSGRVGEQVSDDEGDESSAVGAAELCAVDTACP